MPPPFLCASPSCRSISASSRALVSCFFAVVAAGFSRNDQNEKGDAPCTSEAGPELEESSVEGVKLERTTPPPTRAIATNTMTNALPFEYIFLLYLLFSARYAQPKLTMCKFCTY